MKDQAGHVSVTTIDPSRNIMATYIYVWNFSP